MKKETLSIFKLNPKLRDGLLSVGGRLENAPVDEDMKYPFILRKGHHVTELIICHHHEKLGHLGQESVSLSLRERFWIVNGRSAVRRVLKNCIDSQKKKALSGQQREGKVTARQSNSERTSVHACWSGPFRSNRSKTRQK